MRKIVVTTLATVMIIQSGYSFIFVDPVNLVQNTSTATHEALIYAKQIQQVSNQVQMLKDNVTQLKSTDFHSLSDITKSADALGNAANFGNAITYSTENINEQFAKNFGDDSKNGNYADRMSKMLGTVLDTSRGTLSSAAKQADLLKGQTDGLNQIVSHSDGAAGMKEAIQGTNQLLDATAAQMQGVKLAMMQQQSQEATKNAMEAAKEQAAIDADKAFLDYKVDYQGYKADSRFENIPSFN
jgi:P-type conjugative transfer protein TrbJ